METQQNLLQFDQEQLDQILKAATLQQTPSPPLIHRAEANYCNTSLKQSLEAPQGLSLIQFNSIYFCRIESLQRSALRMAHLLWNSQNVPFVHQLKDITTLECVAVGIIYKHMKLKPSILMEYMQHLEIKEPIQHYVSDTDILYLEDASARIIIQGSSLSTSKVVTGIVVAVKGKLTENKIFEVDAYCLSGVPCSVSEIPLPLKNPVQESNWIAFVSGLQIGRTDSDPAYLKLLRDFLLGCIGTDEQKERCRHVTRFIVAGDTLAEAAVDKRGDNGVIGEADIFLAMIVASIPVDIMPGPNDPTTFNLPQRPIHSIFFPECSQYSRFKLVSNPYSFQINEMQIVGTSGQPVKDICKYSELNEIEALDLCCNSRCIAPTAPDTLSCYPFQDSDPFSLPDDQTFPRVIFSGNHDSFSSKQVVWGNRNNVVDPSEKQKSTTLICIPSFYKVPMLILYNTITSELEPVKFSKF